MRKLTIPLIAILSLITALGAACSSGSNAPAQNAGQPKTITNAPNAATANKSDEETPASVKAAFPGAQSFSKQHKDLNKDQMADVEKNAGAKAPDSDHHSYLAFTTSDGTRKQIGAATVVRAAGKELIIVYESKDGSPVIKEVRGGEGLPSPFLAQFASKGHDDKFQIGSDLKTNGADEATAKAVAEGIRIDVMTMQALYGSAHSH